MMGLTVDSRHYCRSEGWRVLFYLFIYLLINIWVVAVYGLQIPHIVFNCGEVPDWLESRCADY